MNLDKNKVIALVGAGLLFLAGLVLKAPVKELVCGEVLPADQALPSSAPAVSQ